MNTRIRTASYGFTRLAAALLCVTLGACSSVPNKQTEIAPPTDTREAITALALQQLGAAYQANAVGPKTFDESGFTYFAYRGAGATLPRSTQDQLDAGKPIDMARAEPADLLFYRVETPGGADRMLVGLYSDTGDMLMAAPDVQGHSGVSLIDLDDAFWRQRLVGVIRILP